MDSMKCDPCMESKEHSRIINSLNPLVGVRGKGGKFVKGAWVPDVDALHPSLNDDIAAVDIFEGDSGMAFRKEIMYHVSRLSNSYIDKIKNRNTREKSLVKKIIEQIGF